MEIIDIGIIGAGPAGLSAALNAFARNKKTIIFGQKKENSPLYKTKKIDNHVGMPEISGKDMLESFFKHVHSKNIPIKEGRVLQILSMGNHYTINFENQFFNAKTIILATGVSNSKTVQNEDKFLGNGLSYCAACDGMFFKDKIVVVMGEIEEAEEDANFLSNICKKVYYIYDYDKVSHINKEIEIINSKLLEIIGEDKITSVKLKDRELSCEGVFIIKKTMPITNLLYGIELEDNLIKVNSKFETSLKGVYAAGDCCAKPFQISKAIGEGLVAAQEAARFLENTN